jgi:hypothetical protein
VSNSTVELLNTSNTGSALTAEGKSALLTVKEQMSDRRNTYKPDSTLRFEQ